MDSSVGGKVGVNHPRAKNIIGAFHQPVGVWIDTATLNTLPARELRCGLAEVVKYGVILDAAFFDELESQAEAILDRARRGPAARSSPRCCRLKADVVARDEREETGLRAVLNFGHTIGHAIEAVAGYGGAFQHGEAVAVGMVAECRLAERLGWIGPAVTARAQPPARAVRPAHGDPGARPRSAFSRPWAATRRTSSGKIRFVLPRRARDTSS